MFMMTGPSSDFDYTLEVRFLTQGTIHWLKKQQNIVRIKKLRTSRSSCGTLWEIWIFFKVRSACIGR
ncbi:hypothetical protein SCFA_780013 [anaerobic digester metagenome]|uniref:Uncharacterized protein n=1 Tax=anaerobic digester metagenome TaxID=1263854 RepID=A0A485M497_9ZZZZ